MENGLRGLPLSMSAPRGEGGWVKKSANFADKQYWNADEGGGGGVYNTEIRADLLNGSHKPPNWKQL